MIDNADADLRSAGDARRSGRRRARQALSEGAGRATSTAIPSRITEADALIAYLQMLGTQVDFKLYDDKANIR